MIAKQKRFFSVMGRRGGGEEGEERKKERKKENRQIHTMPNDLFRAVAIEL
jgi:hypothetical protein